MTAFLESDLFVVAIGLLALAAVYWVDPIRRDDNGGAE